MIKSARRVFSLIMAVILLFTLFACNKREEKKSESTSTPSASSTSAPSASPSTAPTPVYESVMIGTVHDVSSFLNVRSGPATSYDSVGKAYSGDTFVVIEKNSSGSDWHKIEYGSGTAYVHSDYIRVTTELREVG